MCSMDSNSTIYQNGRRTLNSLGQLVKAHTRDYFIVLPQWDTRPSHEKDVSAKLWLYLHDLAMTTPPSGGH